MYLNHTYGVSSDDLSVKVFPLNSARLPSLQTPTLQISRKIRSAAILKIITSSVGDLATD